MNPISDDVLRQVSAGFRFSGRCVGIVPYGNGHINDTFAVSVQSGGAVRRYILQRINTHVFQEPVKLMENILRVTSFLREKIRRAGGDPDRETLNLVPTLDGSSCLADAQGGYWRAYFFIENTVTLQRPGTARDFYSAGYSVGRFQLLLADFPAGELYETVPRFHDTPERVRQFQAALAADVKNRAAAVKEEIRFVEEHELFTHTLTDLLLQKQVPLRVTHNDTKLNNILFDRDTGRGICLIDLDTVMPGLSLYDFGDSIRFGAATAEEDEPDLSKVHFDLGLFQAFTKGYLEAAGGALSGEEIRLLPVGAVMMTLECGIRFLTDYLNGDIYFKTRREKQNLDRCRTQFRLVSEMEDRRGDMERIVEQCR